MQMGKVTSLNEAYKDQVRDGTNSLVPPEFIIDYKSVVNPVVLEINILRFFYKQNELDLQHGHC